MKCPHCGFNNADGIRFCQECGAPVTQAQAAEPVKNSQPAQPSQTVQNPQNEQNPQYAQNQNRYGQNPQYAQNQNQYGQNPQYAQNQNQYGQNQNQYGQNPNGEYGYQENELQYDLPAEPGAGPQKGGPVSQIKEKFSALTEKLKSFDIKKLGMIAGGAVVLLILVIVLISSLAGGGNGPYIGGSPANIELVESDGEYYFLKNGDTVDLEIEDFDSYAVSMNGKTVMVGADDSLYRIQGTKAKKIADSEYGFLLSPEGSKAVFVDDEDAVCIIPSSGGKKEVISSDNDLESLVFSPNGKILIYSLIDDGDEIMFSWKNGKSKKIGEGTPISVSNNGKYVYFINSKDALCVTDTSGKDNKSTIAKDISGYYFYTNSSGEELMFANDGKIYATVRGGDKVKVANGNYFWFLYPQYLGGTSGRSGRAYISPLKTFRGAVIQTDLVIGFITKKYEMERLAKETDSAVLTADGSRLIYTRGGDLYAIPVKAGADPVRLRKDTDSFVVLKDGKTVFVLDDDELYKVSLKGKEKKITDDVYSLRTNGKALFLLCDYDSRKSEGTLYKSSGGSSRKKIADDVNSVSVYSKMVIYETDDEYYISTDGNKFEKVG